MVEESKKGETPNFDLMSLCRRRGIVYPSFEVYGGLAGFIDYGPVGVRLKKNFENLIRRVYIVELGGMEVECNTVHPGSVFEASGHLNSFDDLVVECTKCSQAERADHLIQDIKDLNVEGKPIEEIKEFLSDITCPKCGGVLGEPYKYNLMFQTSVGPGKSQVVSYLRPETAQSTYLGFNRLWDYARKNLPFGVAQIGRSFRNEISPRQGMIRLREFSQAEIQFFYDPENLVVPDMKGIADIEIDIFDGEEKEHRMTIGEASKKLCKYEPVIYHLGRAVELFIRAGLDKDRLRLRQHREDERSFYSKDTWDVEYRSDELGLIEIVGIAYRTDYDLGQHEKHSKRSMHVSIDGKKFIPHVVEVAYGIDRPIYCMLESCLDDRGFSFPKDSSPFIAGVFPLVKKDGLLEEARVVYEKLADLGFYVFFDQAGSIGKRYARTDEIGVPFCITYDYESKDDECVTVRKRDSMEQTRVKIDALADFLRNN